MNNLPHTIDDTKPWYVQFWPWFLITLLGSVVIASFMMLYIANRHADDLVVDEYYKTGLAINRELENRQRAEALGISAQLLFYPGRVEVETSGPVGDSVLELQLSHPLEADQDFRVVLQRQTDGTYSATLTQDVAQRWHWKMQPQTNAQWRLDGTLSSEDFAHARGF